MSLDKAVKHGKEHRKPYRGSARFDRSCRPGGRCEHCRRNRLFQSRRITDAPDYGTDALEGYADLQSVA